MATHHIVTIVGSLRKESFSLKIANALAKLAPPSLKLDVTTLHGISFFNQDLEANPPADWVAFREKLQKSHGVLFVTPEYNRGIPGVLKNAIDVGSRPYGKSSFLEKPTAIISNSPWMRCGPWLSLIKTQSCHIHSSQRSVHTSGGAMRRAPGALPGTSRLRSRALSFSRCREDRKELINPCDLQRILHPLVDAHQR